MDTDDKKPEKELPEKSGSAFDLLDYIGEIGVYQITLFLLLGTMEYFGVDSLTINFTAGHMDHWCQVEPLNDFSHAQQKYIAIPYLDDKQEDGYEQCEQFNLPWNSYTDDQFYNWNRTTMTDPSNVTGCNGKWVYDQSEFYSTIVSRWDLVCDKAWLTSFVSTIYMAGRLVGALACGFVSDGFGRLWGIFIFTAFRFLGALVSLYAGSYGVFVTGRFVVAAGSTGANLCAYVMICEVIGNRFRAWFGALWQCIFSLGYAILPCYAYFVRDDKNLQSVLTWPILVFFIIVVLTPESPRWLIAKGKEQAAEDVIKFIAECNHREVPEKLDFSAIHEDIEKQTEAKKAQSTGKFTDLFVYPNMRKKTLIVWFNWFCNSLVYYGLSLNAASLPGNLYVTSFLYGISEIPANLFGIFLMNKVGRMWTIAFSLLFGGACSFIVVFFILFDVAPGAITTFAVLGKMGIAISFTTAYVYTVEIFPTPVRNIGIGSASMCARISGMIAPFMGDPLISVWEPLPSLIFGIFATLSGFSMMLLPETLNKPLPSTIEEAEQFGKKTKNMIHSTKVEPLSIKPTATDMNGFGSQQSTNNEEMAGNENGHVTEAGHDNTTFAADDTAV